MRARGYYGVGENVMIHFDAARFNALLEATGWPVAPLGALSSVSDRTIQRWQGGGARPMRVEFERVMAVLAQERCSACHGLGWVEPDEATRAALITSVCRAPTPRLRLMPSKPPPKPRRYALADGVTLDASGRVLRRGEVTVALTPKEAEVLEYLAERAGQWAPWPHAMSVHLARLRRKIEAAGIDHRAFIASRKGAAGCMLLVAPPDERAGAGA